MAGETIAGAAVFVTLWLGIYLARVGFRVKFLPIALVGIAIGILSAVVFWLVVSKFV